MDKNIDIINGKALYTTKGAAREYGRVGCNFYRGCPHECSYCVSPDTPVLMADGTSKRIDDIYVGDEIYGVEKQGSNYNTMVKAKVIAKSETNKEAYRITLSDGRQVVSSADHRFLTKRGWKYVTGSEQGKDRRPHLTTNDWVANIANYTTGVFEVTDDYRRGYLSGMIRGDGHLAKYDYNGIRQCCFRLALKEKEGVDRTREYLAHFGIKVNDFKFPMVDRATKQTVFHIAIRKMGIFNYEKIQSLIEWSESQEWLRGFMAGIYDAEGCKGDAKRLVNSDQQILDTYIKCLETFGFRYVFDKAKKKDLGKTVQTIRIIGGLAESIRFATICRPAIVSKFSFEGCKLKNEAGRIRVVGIERISDSERLVDIETTTGNFFANGIVAHNCYLKRGAPSKWLGDNIVQLKKCFRDEQHAFEVFRREAIKYLPTLRETGVFFSFTTDPMILETRYLTLYALEILGINGIPAKVLTKNSEWMLSEPAKLYLGAAKRRGYDVAFGFTLTGRDDMEPKACPNINRIYAMKLLHDIGFKTWASIEPVIDWQSAERVIRMSLSCCDHYKLGLRSGVKKDYYNITESGAAIMRIVSMVEAYGKTIYLKESARRLLKQFLLPGAYEELLSHTVDMDGKNIGLQKDLTLSP